VTDHGDTQRQEDSRPGGCNRATGSEIDRKLDEPARSSCRAIRHRGVPQPPHQGAALTQHPHRLNAHLIRRTTSASHGTGGNRLTIAGEPQHGEVRSPVGARRRAAGFKSASLRHDGTARLSEATESVVENSPAAPIRASGPDRSN